MMSLALLAGGCAELNVRSGYPLSATSGKGVLAVGITADETFPSNFFWHLRRAGSDESRDVTFHTLYDPLIWDHPRGRLVFIELDDGDYEFFDWGAPMGMESAAYFRIPFSIHAGRVTYLGRIALAQDAAAQTSAVTTTDHYYLAQGAGAQTYTVTTTDHYAEDKPLLSARISNLSDALVDQSPAVFQPCRDASCKKLEEIPGTSRITIVIVRSRH